MKNIIADSCCDLSSEIREETGIVQVPLTIRIDDERYIDDVNLDTDEIIREMKKSANATTTSCPSPDDFLKEFVVGESNFVVTLSDKLSGSYNSAALSKQIFDEKKDGFVHIFNSKSASIGETLIGIKIKELIGENKSDQVIVEEVEDYIENMNTYFILESLENLIKAGRISKVKAKLISLMSIVPIMKSSGGEIDLSEKVRGAKKAFNRLVEIVGEQAESMEDKVLGIAHCNALDKAQNLKRQIEERYNFKRIVIVETQGISTVYANDGGIVIAF